MTRRRLHGALLCYGILAAIAALVLEGPFRLVTWIFLGGLAIKSWVVYERDRQERS
jgi:hypothetical protein